MVTAMQLPTLQEVAPDPSFNILLINGGVLIRPWQAEKVPSDVEALTKRELEILSLIAEGLANKMVGERLYICERTVKNHVSCIMAKLRASDRTHAVVTAVRLGWLAI